MTKWIPIVLIFIGCFAMAESNNHWQSLPKSTQQLLGSMEKSWDQLSDSERNQYVQLANQFDSLPKEKQQQLQNRFQRWQALSVEERVELRQKYQRFKQLTPEQQQQIKQRFRWFKSLPQDQRDQLRASWQSLTSAEKNALRKRFRSAGREERQKLRENLIQRRLLRRQ